MKRTPLRRKTSLKSIPKSGAPLRKSGLGSKNRSAAPKSTTTTPRMNLADASRALMHREASAKVPRQPPKPVPPPTRAPRPESDGSFIPATRALILARDDMQCVRCGASAETTGVNLQHRVARGMGGTTDPLIASPANGIVLCGSATTGCHGWVETHLTEAALYGWAVPSWANPASVPVLYKHADEWRFLARDGTARAADLQCITDAMDYAVARNSKGICT